MEVRFVERALGFGGGGRVEGMEEAPNGALVRERQNRETRDCPTQETKMGHSTSLTARDPRRKNTAAAVRTTTNRLRLVPRCCSSSSSRQILVIHRHLFATPLLLLLDHVLVKVRDQVARIARPQAVARLGARPDHPHRVAFALALARPLLALLRARVQAPGGRLLLPQVQVRGHVAPPARPQARARVLARPDHPPGVGQALALLGPPLAQLVVVLAPEGRGEIRGGDVEEALDGGLLLEALGKVGDVDPVLVWFGCCFGCFGLGLVV